MKIALLGYGKMGKVIEGLALEAGDNVVFKADSHDELRTNREAFQKAEVAIEFSSPEGAYHNIIHCLENGVPVVSGTTGWLHHFEEVKQVCEERGGAFFYASNFSIGVNVFFSINRQLAKLMDRFPEYQIEMEEIHHTQKLDAPSGTAITLAEGILEEVARKNQWVNQSTEMASELPIISKRIEKVPGTHEITYRSEVDTITIRHEAHSRIGFAKGALTAARWLIGRKGVFGMNEMLGLQE